MEPGEDEDTETERIQVEVLLLSGQSASVAASVNKGISSLLVAAGKQLGVHLGQTVTSDGHLLNPRSTIAETGLKDGDAVFATVRCSRLVSTRHIPAFALIRDDASVMVWGDLHLFLNVFLLQRHIKFV